MNSYEAVRYRYSCRRYRKEKLDDKVIADIKLYIEGMYSLYPDSEVSIDFIDVKEDKYYVSRWASVRAPYYVCISTKYDDKSFINAGYMVEHLALYLTSKGIASAIKDIRGVQIMEKDGLKPAILLGLGIAKEVVYRESRYAIRKSIQSIVLGLEKATEPVKEMIESARLAPSAFNLQPWRFAVGERHIDVLAYKSKLVDDRLCLISVGCAIANMSVTADDKWQDAHVENIPCDESIFKNSRYVCTIILEKGKNQY